jgi:hypothetical protein
MRAPKDWTTRSTRVKLSAMVGMVSVVLSALVAYLLLAKLELNDRSASESSAAMVAVARVASCAMILAAGFLPYHAIMKFGPERRIALVEYLFAALHWAVFVGALVLTIPRLAPSYIRSGDIGGMLFAAFALALCPLEIGRVRSIGCLLLAFVAALLFVINPNPYAALTTIGIIFLYVLHLWVKAAYVDRIRSESATTQA